MEVAGGIPQVMSVLWRGGDDPDGQLKRLHSTVKSDIALTYARLPSALL